MLEWLSEYSGAISGGLIVAIVPKVMEYLSGGAAAKAEKRDGFTWMEYPTRNKFFPIVIFAIPAVLFTFLYFHQTEQGKDDAFAFLFLIGFFFILSFPLYLEFAFVRIAYDENSIYCYTPWRKNRVINFSEISGEPKFSPVNKWWVIPTKSQGKIRVQHMIRGSEEFITKLSEDYKKIFNTSST